WDLMSESNGRAPVASNENIVARLIREGAVANYTAIVAVAGGMLYALIALAYERFYREFGLAPDDVGVTPASLIPRTAVAFAFLALVASGGFFAAVALWVIASAPIRRRI